VEKKGFKSERVRELWMDGESGESIEEVPVVGRNELESEILVRR